MTMQESLEERAFQEGSDEDEAPVRGRYNCAHCDFSTDRLPDVSAHYRNEHPDKRGRWSKTRTDTGTGGKSDKQAPVQPGRVSEAELSPAAQEFAEALDAAVNMNPRQRMSLIRAFDRDTRRYSSDPEDLTKLLDDYGVSYRMSRQIVRDMGLTGSERHGMSSGGGQQVPGLGTVYTTPQGQVFVVPGGNQPPHPQPSGSGQPIFVDYGRDRGERGEPQTPPEVEKRLEHMEQKFDQLVESLTSQRRQEEVQQRRIMEPILNEDGGQMVDGQGEPMFRIRYEPINPQQESMDQFFSHIVRLRQMEKEVYGQQSQQGEGDAGWSEVKSAISESMGGLKQEFEALKHDMERERAVRDARQEASDEVYERMVKPLEERLGQREEQLRTLQASDDMPHELRYKQGNFDRVTKRLDTMIERADSFFKLQYLQQAGVPPEKLVDLVQAQGTKGGPIASEDEKAEAVRKVRG